MPPRPAVIALLLLQGLLAAPAGAQVPAAAGASLRGLSVAPDGAVWASGTGGTVLQSRDGGRSWTARSIPDAGGLDLRDVAAVSASTAYAM
ncbi:MAG: oxidoreductase, partial [Deltaproteobacteria bacterium]